MARSRPIARTAVALAALALLAGCSDDGETTSTGASDGPTTTDLAGIDADVAETACEGLEATILLPVDEEQPEDDSVLEDALNTLAETRPNPVGEDAATVRTMIGAEGDPEVEALPDEALDGLVVEAFHALERVQDWGRGACGVDGVTWACPATDGVTKFETVGMPIGDGEPTTTTTEPGAASPEEVFAEGESDGDPVVVSESDSEVVAAWLDDDGAAVEVITVIEDGGWRSDGTQQCLTPEELVAPPKFETVPAEIGDPEE